MFTPQKWSQGKLVLILSVTFFIMTLWGIAGQSPNFIETSLKILTQVNTIYPHPYQNAFIGLFLLIALITTSIVVPNKYILQSPRFFQIVENITEKTVVLSILYLCFDFIGIGIIIFRNT
jgi:hypothetical protein